MRCFYSVTAANTGGDVISRAFLHALVALIGGYREALTFLPNQKIQFDEAAFLASRPAHMKHFLESLLHLQVIYVLEQPRIVLQLARTGPLARLLVPFAHPLLPQCLLDSRASLRSFARSLVHSRAHGKEVFVHDMPAFHAVLTRSEGVFLVLARFFL